MAKDWRRHEAIWPAGQDIEVGDTVYVDFGDSRGVPPEVEAVVTYIGDKGVTLDVPPGIHARRFNWVEIVHIEVKKRKDDRG